MPTVARDRDQEWCLPYPLCSYVALRVFIRPEIDKDALQIVVWLRYFLTAKDIRNNTERQKYRCPNIRHLHGMIDKLISLLSG